MAVLRQIEMTGPEEAAAVEQGDGALTFAAMVNVPDMLAVKLESGGRAVVTTRAEFVAAAEAARRAG